MTEDVEHFLKCLSHFRVSVESSLFRSVPCFLVGLFVLLMTNFMSSLYILEINSLSDMGLMEIFSHSVGSHFVLLTMSFALQKLLSFRRSYLLIVSHSVCATGIIFRKRFPVPVHSSVLFTFSSVRFSVIGFMLKSLIQMDLSFLHGNRYGSIFIFSYMLISSYASTIC